LGIIARATGKVIARAIASAIYACCVCNYSQMAQEIHVIKYQSYTSSVDRKRAIEPWPGPRANELECSVREY